MIRSNLEMKRARNNLFRGKKWKDLTYFILLIGYKPFLLKADDFNFPVPRY